MLLSWSTIINIIVVRRVGDSVRGQVWSCNSLGSIWNRNSLLRVANRGSWVMGVWFMIRMIPNIEQPSSRSSRRK